MGDASRHVEGVGVADGDDLVDEARVVVRGPEVLAHALGQVRPTLATGVDRPFGVGRDDADRGVLFLEVLRHAADRAAGTGAGDEVRHRAVGVAPDLGSGRRVVRVGLAGFEYWSGRNAPGRLAGQAFGGRVVRIGVLGRDRGRTDDDLGAVGLEEAHLLGGHLVAHHEDAPVAALGRDDGEADAGVAAGRLDDDAAGLQAVRRVRRRRSS